MKLCVNQGVCHFWGRFRGRLRTLGSVCLMCICLNIPAFAGTLMQTRITIQLGETTLKNVFEEIRKQIHRPLVYNDEQILLEEKVEANFIDEELEEVLEKVLEGKGITYKFLDDYILIVKQELSVESPKSVLLQGIVKDKKGEPLPGVSVVVKGTSLGVSTDIDGNFKLNVPEPEKIILVFSMVGMKAREVVVGNRLRFEITLEEESSDLDEVVVIGYGSSKKKDLTGSVERFDSKIIEESVATNVADMMQGQIAGLSILAGSGAPGEGARLEIRGVPSLSGATTPLVVVDNVPMAPDFDINELNPGDIASIDVLKGASAAAIYGSRGAAGVIMVTLKEGKRGEKPTVNYQFSYGLNTLADGMNTLTTDEFKLLLMEATRNSAKADGYEDITQYIYYKTFTQPNYFGEENTEWMKLLMQNGTVQQHRVSIRGGAESFSYNASFGYNTEKGQLKSLYYDRYTYTIGFNTDLNKWVKATMDVSGTLADGKTNNFFRMSDVVVGRPDIKAYNADGTLYMHKYMENGRLVYAKNPIAELTENGTDKDENNLNLSGSLEFKILPSLTLKGMYAFASRQREEYDYASSNTQTGSDSWHGQKGAGKKIHNKYRKNEFEGQLSYMKSFGKNRYHSLQAVGVISYYREENMRYSLKKVDFADDDIQNGIWQGTNPPRFGDEMDGYDRGSKMLSYIARANYNFKGRYLLTASVRADGSTKFAPSNRWGIFPSVAAGWVLSEEKFMKRTQNWLPFLKLRAEWGLTGNGWVGEYGWRTLFENTEYEHLPAIVPDQTGNDGLKWEQTEQWDLALDFGFLKNQRLRGTLGFYLKKTDGLLYSFNMAPSTGLETTQTNFANIENRGVEFSINANIIQHKDWKWSFGFNINKNRNKVTNIDNEFVSQPGSAYLSNTVIQEGKSLGLIFGYETDGVFQNQKEVDYYESLNEEYPYQTQYAYQKTVPGDLKMVDQDGDGRVNVAYGSNEDKVVLGCSRPKFEGGFNTRLAWKGLTLSIQATYSYGAKKIWGARDKQFNFMPTNLTNLLDIAMNRWTPENPTNEYPCIRLNNYQNNFTDFAVCNASYLKIQNINLSYRLPNHLLERTKVLKVAEVFTSFTNPFLVTTYPGSSVESYSSNVIMGASNDTEAYPRTWTFSFGLKATF